MILARPAGFSTMYPGPISWSLAIMPLTVSGWASAALRAMMPSATVPAAKNFPGELRQVSAIQSAAALTLASPLVAARAGCTMREVMAKNKAMTTVRSLCVVVFTAHSFGSGLLLPATDGRSTNRSPRRFLGQTPSEHSDFRCHHPYGCGTVPDSHRIPSTSASLEP